MTDGVDTGVLVSVGVIDCVGTGVGELGGVTDCVGTGVGEFGGEFGGVTDGVDTGVLVSVGVIDGVIDGVLVRVGVIDGVIDGVDTGVVVSVGVIDCVDTGVLVRVGVIDGVVVGVIVGNVEQSLTVFTLPKISKVTTYFTAPSITNEYPPGFDEYVLEFSAVLLYIINPFVIGVVLSIYLVSPVLRLQAAYSPSCGFDNEIIL